MERSTPSQQMKFGDFCKELLEKSETEEPSYEIKNHSITDDYYHLDNEVGQICWNMDDMNLAEHNYYSDFQPALSTSYGSGSSSSETSFRSTLVLDPMLIEELNKGSLHWDEEKVLYYARILLDEEIQLLQNSLDFCQDQLILLSAVKRFLSNETLVMNSSFIRNGSMCLQKMIKKIKKTVYAYALTQILATVFYHLMIHPIARVAVLRCLEVFGSGPNRVLYEQAISFCIPLATSEIGCFSLKMCIGIIRGEERMMLLERITECSLHLSIDPHGNYIVQHVLGLRISSINQAITVALLGQFVSISQTKEGSHVTEKLMECYGVGPMAVVQEIVSTPGAAFLLARHPFGNYVIQKALVMTKNKVGYKDMYKSLVDALRPHYKELSHTVGKHVLSHIKDEFIGLNKKRPAY